MATVLLVAAVVIPVGVEAAIRWRRRRLETPQDYLRAGDRALKKGDLEGAEQHYLDSIRLDYENPEARYKLSLVAWEREDYAGVIEHLRECQWWVPETSDLEHGLGAAHYHLGDHEAAVRHYRRALELEPENEEVRGNLAALYHELGRVDEGREVWPEYEPPAAEELERRKRIARQLAGQGERELQRWDRALETVVWGWSAARIGFFAWIAWWVLTWVYEWVAGPGTAPQLDKAFVTGFRVAYLALWAALLVLRLMDSHRDHYVRWVMRRAGVAPEDMEAEVPHSAGPPWWKVELSWGHLVLWAGLPILVCVWRDHSSLPDWTVGVFIYLMVLWFMKGAFMLHLLTSSDDDMYRWHAQYRFFGTPKGAAVGLVGLPAVLAVLAYGIWLLMDVVGL